MVDTPQPHLLWKLIVYSNGDIPIWLIVVTEVVLSTRSFTRFFRTTLKKRFEGKESNKHFAIGYVILCFFRGPIPFRSDCINTAPHPIREASVVIVTRRSPWYYGQLSDPPLKVASLDKLMCWSKFPLCNFKACVLSFQETYGVTGYTPPAGKLAVMGPNTWATILIQGEEVASRFHKHV